MKITKVNKRNFYKERKAIKYTAATFLLLIISLITINMLNVAKLNKIIYKFVLSKYLIFILFTNKIRAAFQNNFFCSGIKNVKVRIFPHRF